MTVFSLANACDLEHFSNNTKTTNENYENMNYNAPVVPMPTDPPGGQHFGDTSYQWPSTSNAVRDMTTRNVNSGTFNPTVGSDSQGWGDVNFGQDYWGGQQDTYNFQNNMLNDNQPQGGNNFQMIMPGMRPQGAQMPTSRAHIMQKEDFNGRPKMRKPEKPAEPEYPEPDFPEQKMKHDQKNVWIVLVILFIILAGIILYKSKYFG